MVNILSDVLCLYPNLHTMQAYLRTGKVTKKKKKIRADVRTNSRETRRIDRIDGK